MDRKRSGGVGDEAGQRQKKPRLEDSASEEERSESNFSAHAMHSDEISSPISARERSYSASPPPTQDVDMMSDSSESFPLTKSKSSEASRKRKERHYRSGHGGHHSEKDNRPPRRDDSLRRRDKYSHSRSPAPSRGATRDRPLRGETLKQESSSGRNSPMYFDERSRDSLREDRYGRDGDHDEGRYHDRLSVPPRLLTVREDSRLSDRRGSREQKEMYERGGGGGGGHRDIKLVRAGSRGGGGERGGSFSMTREDRRPMKGSRSPRRTHAPSERSRHGRHEPSSTHLYREEERERQREHHHQRVRKEKREKHHGGRHHRSREEKREVSSVVSSVMENITSGSEEEGLPSQVQSLEGGAEKIEELIRDLESGSSSGEISEEESDEGGARREKEGKGEEEKESHSEKDKSSDGEIHSPPAEGKGKPHTMRSKFDSDPESDSDDEPKSKGVPLSSLAATSGYHDTVMSEEEHSGMSDIEQQEKERAEEKESDLSAQLSRELEDVERSPTPVELPCYLPALMGCRNVEENYEYLNKIEEGTYGVVHRAKDKKTGKVFALKRLKLENEKEGFPITSLREIDMLLKARHPNVVGVREIVLGKNMDRIYIVFEYVEHDLKELMETMKQPFLQGEVKTLMIQLLRAVHHLHDNWIIHRDLKASNLLVSHQAILKVADFGLAREYGSPLRKYTPIVVTLWYRSPELLLGAPEYSTPVDIWSVGCIFAEMMLQKPLFQGKGEIDQLNQIFKLLGTPNEQIWKGYNDLPTVKKVTFTNQPYNHLRKKFPPSLITQNGFDLLNRFLTYDPKKRITAKEALDHPYFKEPPMPIPPSMFNTWPAKSEMGHRKKAKSPTPPVGGAFQFAEDGPGFNLKF